MGGERALWIRHLRPTPGFPYILALPHLLALHPLPFSVPLSISSSAAVLGRRGCVYRNGSSALAPASVHPLPPPHPSLSSPLQPYWGGGAVFTATAALHWHLPQSAPGDLEDGTLPFLEIVALEQGLEV